MSDRTATIDATGRAQGTPDRVDLRLAVRARGEEATDVRRTATDRSADLRNALAAAGLPDERIRTADFGVRRRRTDPHEERDEPPEYEATETVAVVLHDLDALGVVLGTAVDDAGAEIEDVTFAFRTETERELRREAIRDAVRTARERAEAAASAEGLTVAGVRSIETRNARARNAGARRREAGQQAATAAGNAGPGSGPIDVKAAIEVEYELADGG